MDSWREIFKSQRNLFYGKKEEGNNLHQEYKPKNRCIKCGANDSIEIMKKKYGVCDKCGFHSRLDSKQRIELIFDKGSIKYLDNDLDCINTLNFPRYDEKLNQAKEISKLKSAVVTGQGRIFDKKVYFGVMDYRFIMGSMGEIEGEKITRMIEGAIEDELPVIIFTASGGARIQEGMLSLYQMIKVSAALKKHSNKGLLYLTIATDPTTGGVNASFASLGDIIISEPNAVVGFAGKRVIQQTIKEKLPDDFQQSELVLKNGFIDCIVDRRNMKEIIFNILKIHSIESTLNNDTKKVIDIMNKDIERINKDIESINPNEIVHSPWETVKIARNRKRPNYKVFIDVIIENFIELHGDRCFGDDSAVVGGIGLINGIPVTVIANAKGASPQENIKRNMGMAHPEGYRKALRLMKQAEKFNRPILCFVDTPGAYCGVEAENRGQGQVIAKCLTEIADIKTPIITIIHGEGGSGGALAIGVGDYTYMYKNSIYSVISPESAAAIVFKDSSKAEEISPYLKFKASDLIEYKLVDEILDEPFEGLHVDGVQYVIKLKKILYEKIIYLKKLDKKVLVEKRNHKIRFKISNGLSENEKCFK